MRDGHITALADGGLDAAERLDVSGLTVFPGVIDQHFHTFRGFGWETHHNGTRAAAKGGITTAVDIPLEDPPFLSGAVLREKLAAIDGECHVDYACFGGYLASDPDEITRIADAGVAAYKLFTGGWRHRACIRVWTTASRSTRCGAPPRLVCPRPFSARRDVVAHETEGVRRRAGQDPRPGMRRGRGSPKWQRPSRSHCSHDYAWRAHA